MITPEQSAHLKEYFPVKSHEFLNGNTYITEEAITNRLDEVDPSWQFKRLEIRREGMVVTATYCLIVCGVERDGVGMASVQLSKDKDREVNEAEKSAATDALKRCARLFGIGRYILEMGKAVTDYQSLERWLIQRRGVNTSTGEINVVEKSAADRLMGNGHDKPRNLVQNAPDPLPARNSGNSQFIYNRVELFTEAAKVKALADVNSSERNNTIIKMEGEGAFKDAADYQQCIELVIARISSPEHGRKKVGA